MPYHSNGVEDAKKNITKKTKERIERKKTQKELFENVSENEMDKLKKHSKMHKGGMSSKHIKNMIKFMKTGMSFSMAHNKAKALDKK